MVFHHDDSGSSSNHTCPDKSLADPPQVPFIGSMSFHQVAVIIAGACTIISCLICFFLIFRHATRYAVPKEQKQVIRLIFIIPVFAVASFLSVAFNNASIYIQPLTTLYESLALSAFFLLLLAYIQEDDDERQAFFETSGQMAAYRKTALAVFQFPVVEFLTFILTEITEATGTYCASSFKLYFASIWVSVITGISTGMAIMSVLRFYKSMKTRVDKRKPMAKLLAFKGIVGLTWLQNIVFSFLSSEGDLHPSSKLTYKDLTIAIPNLVVAFEMILFSLAFLHVFRTSEYNLKKGSTLGHGSYYGGVIGLGAVIQALNITDVVKAIIGAISGGRSGGRNYPATKVYASGGSVEYDRVELIPPQNTHYDSRPEAGPGYPGGNMNYDPRPEVAPGYAGGNMNYDPRPESAPEYAPYDGAQYAGKYPSPSASRYGQ
ncbi:DUF300-domain-containing protein [Mollisia scopiformis]|uniref:DUF300-domain-containing protein n=1 Tax=Mollisia scopiformis TaxID=149040 RepID=A0A132B9G2_MOLSC|nr:DUF300-domain-containing protein [Mollisia scopiformis]KUJ09035.1 DUF300-domain-containing protein [Mollisia scopiformis]